ncbi:hypothetical protein [Flavobacterium sp. J27]|uniref:hypothetical protein n=1 Tax=Flavobacterium sp. J27 TaxID=2060419 RepID=UPI001030B6B1|nr:hypothetical protein [Flavobacterium sp. J27]
MKISLLFFLVFFYSCKSKVISDELLIGRKINDEFKFFIDTTKYKSFLYENINFQNNVKLDKVQIMKQQSIGQNPIDFYYVLVTDKAKKIKIAKWLEKIDDNLYFNEDYSSKEASVKSHYIICVGDNNCYPQYIMLDTLKTWSCDKNLSCYISSDSTNTNCKIYKTVILK